MQNYFFQANRLKAKVLPKALWSLTTLRPLTFWGETRLLAYTIFPKTFRLFCAFVLEKILLFLCLELIWT